MKVFAKLFAAWDDPSGQMGLETLKGLAEASKDFELVPYDPDEHDDVEMVWMTDGARELTEEDKLNSDVLQRRK